MAIAYDTSAGLYTTASDTSTVNLAASASGSIAVILCTNGNGAALSGVTVDGVAATLISSNNFAGTGYFSSWYYLNPPTSAVDYVATATDATDDVEICVLIYSGAKQSGQPDSTANANGSPSVTISTTTVADNSWLASVSRNTSSGPPAAGTGTTSRRALSLSNYGDSAGAKTPAGSHSMQWTAGSGTTYAMIVSIAPSTGGGSGPANVKTYNGIASASTKTVNGLAIGSVKTVNGLN